MFTIILLIYLQSNLHVNLVGSTVVGEYATHASCEAAAAHKRGPLPVPRGYAAAWQDALCTPINRDVRVGNEGITEFEKLLAAALKPGACQSDEQACRRAGIVPDPDLAP